METVNHGKNLTKTILMGLPEGVYLVSSVYERSGLPSFAEKLGPVDQRQTQWLRIKKAGVDQQHYIVCDTKKDFDGYIKEHTPPSKAKPA